MFLFLFGVFLLFLFSAAALFKHHYFWAAILIATAGTTLPLAFPIYRYKWLERLRPKLKDLILLSNNRNIANELVLWVIGDEASAAFGTVYLLNWLHRWLFVALASLAVVGTITTMRSQEQKYVNDVMWLALTIALISTLTIVLGLFAYGVDHALLSIDSPTTTSPAPAGDVDFKTIATTGKGKIKLKHSVPDESAEHIAVWLTNKLPHAARRQ